MLYYQQQGQGLPVVFLHGWGFWGGIFAPITAELSDYQTFTVDLAGYGQSPPLSEYGLKQLADSVVECLPLTEPAVWLGWSFGGLVALAIARYYPEKIRALVLVASTPCFVQRDDWQHAVPLKTLATFGQQVRDNHGATLKRFVSLHVKDKVQLRWLRQQLQQQPTPSLVTLTASLHLLTSCDLRTDLNTIHRPVLLLLGHQDTLIPQQLIHVYQSHKYIQTHCIQGAGHLPFLSHKSQFLVHLRAFLTQQKAIP